MRKLVACLALRNGGSRLYGKPLHFINVDQGISVIQHIIDCLKRIDSIDDIIFELVKESKMRFLLK